jgi:hypothetical protein
MTHEITETNHTLQRWSKPSNIGEAMQLADILAKSDWVPKEHRGKPGNVLVCMQFAEELGMPILAALQNVAVINGKPSIWGDMALALVRKHPDCEGVVETFDAQTKTARCEVRRRGQPEPIVAEFSIEDAKRAGLAGKAGPWKQYPQRMLQMRARGFALRDSFPDALKGVITAEEAMDYPEPRKVTATATKPRGVAAALEAVEAKAEPAPDPTAEARRRLVDAYLGAGFRDWQDAAPTITEIIGREITADAPPTLEEVEKVERDLAVEESDPDTEPVDDPQSVADFINDAKGGE